MSDEKVYLKIEIPAEEEAAPAVDMPAAAPEDKTRLNVLGDRMADATRQLGEQATSGARQIWQEKGRPAVNAGLKWSGQKAAKQSGKVTAIIIERVTAEIKREAAEMPAKLTSDNVKQTAATTARRGLRWLSQAIAYLGSRLANGDAEGKNAGSNDMNRKQE